MLGLFIFFPTYWLLYSSCRLGKNQFPHQRNYYLYILNYDIISGFFWLFNIFWCVTCVEFLLVWIIFLIISDKSLFMGKKSERCSCTKNDLKKKNQKFSSKSHSGSQHFKWKLLFPVSRWVLWLPERHTRTLPQISGNFLH